jgi:hypothetical protein
MTERRLHGIPKLSLQGAIPDHHIDAPEGVTDPSGLLKKLAAEQMGAANLEDLKRDVNFLIDPYTDAFGAAAQARLTLDENLRKNIISRTRVSTWEIRSEKEEIDYATLAFRVSGKNALPDVAVNSFKLVHFEPGKDMASHLIEVGFESGKIATVSAYFHNLSDRDAQSMFGLSRYWPDPSPKEPNHFSATYDLREIPGLSIRRRDTIQAGLLEPMPKEVVTTFKYNYNSIERHFVPKGTHKREILRPVPLIFTSRKTDEKPMPEQTFTNGLSAIL